MRINKLAVAMAAFAMLQNAPAQTPQPANSSVSLTLEKAVEIALAPQGAIRRQMAAELVRQAEAQKRTALSAVLPNVDGSWTYSSFTRNLAAFGISASPQIGIPLVIPRFVGPVDTYDWRATAGWNLLDWSAWQRYRASKARLDAVSAEERTARNQTTALVIRAYSAAQRAEQMVATAESNIALAERVLRLARSQKDAGMATGLDVTRAEVQLAQEKSRQIYAVQERDRSRLELLRLLNMGLDMTVELADPLVYKPVDAPEAGAAVARARQNRPELTSQMARERAGQLNKSAARLSRLPSVQAFGDYGTIGTSAGTGLPTRVVGLRVNIPVWDGGRRDAQRAEAGSLLRQEELRGRDLRQLIEFEVRTSIDLLRTADAQVRAANETAALAEKEVEQAERRFREGVATSVEIADAQARLGRAREAKVTAIYQHRAARAELSLAVGDIAGAIQ
ncbi:MAG: TolC family protein [Bryobacteraceae bacterium]|nr:TolC family protein [Bryobacteraceae bacterium]